MATTLEQTQVRAARKALRDKCGHLCHLAFVDIAAPDGDGARTPALDLLRQTTEVRFDVASEAMTLHARRRPFAMVVLRHIGANEAETHHTWGVVPLALIHAMGGVVRPDWCAASVEAAPKPLSRTTPYVALPDTAPDRVSVQLEAEALDGLFGTRELSLDQLTAAARARVIALRTPHDAARLDEVGRDELGYAVLACGVAAMGTEAFIAPDRRVATWWLERECTLAAFRIGWHAIDLLAMSRRAFRQPRDDALREKPIEQVAYDASGDITFVDLPPAALQLCGDATQVTHLLRAGRPAAADDTGVRIEGGFVRAHAAVWAPDLLAWYRRRHEMNLARARARVGVITHPGVLAVFREIGERMACRLQPETLVSRAIGTGIPRTPRVVIGSIAKVVEAMPGCIARLHERATSLAPRFGGAPYIDDYSARLIYHEFMAGNGVPHADMMAAQEDVLATRVDPRKASAEYANVSKNWATRDGLLGHSCRTLFSRGMCPYREETLGRAQRACQQMRAAQLGIEDAGTPAGTPLMYAQSFHRARLAVAMDTK